MKKYFLVFPLVVAIIFLVGATSQSELQGSSQMVDDAAMVAAPPCCTLTVPAAAFRPRCHSIQYDTNGVRMTTIADGTSSGCDGPAAYHAPVYLPEGAVIRSMTLRGYDNSGGDIGRQVRLILVRTLSNSFLHIAEIGTGGPERPLDVVRSVPVNQIVEPGFGYYLDLELRKAGEGGINDLKFYQAQIEYGYDTFLVDIQK